LANYQKELFIDSASFTYCEYADGHHISPLRNFTKGNDLEDDGRYDGETNCSRTLEGHHLAQNRAKQACI